MTGQAEHLTNTLGRARCTAFTTLATIEEQVPLRPNPVVRQSSIRPGNNTGNSAIFNYVHVTCQELSVWMHCAGRSIHYMYWHV